jgi:hypothetical protein
MSAKMNLHIKSELKKWGIYLAALCVAIYVHEVGHCVVAWAHGIKAVPTPAKEYLLEQAPERLNPAISLGGVVGTFIVSITGIAMFWKGKFNAALLAGTLAMPGAYTLMFILKGRGHDATEFQEAQAALGFSYDGHALDWWLLALFAAGVLAWIIKCKPGIKVIPGLLAGTLITVIFIAGLQTLNNHIFDPIFLQETTTPK